MTTTKKPKIRGVHRALEVPVTPEIIEQAMQRDSGHCMVADAIRAAYPEVKKVSVDLQSIRFTDPKKGWRYIYLTPVAAQIALINFDQGIEVEPFTVRAKAAAQVVRSWSNTTSGPDGQKKRPSQRKEGLRQPSPGSPANVPIVVGGPPLRANAVLANRPGQRRRFGLKQLKP